MRERREAPSALTRVAAATGAAVLALLAVIASARADDKSVEDLWSIGRSGGGLGGRFAPVSAFPVPTPPEELPTPKLRAPPGFKVETWASGVLDARMMRQGDKGTVFVSSLFVANKVYAVVERDGGREVKTLASGMSQPNGLAFHKGALYVATPKKIVRFDGVEDRLDAPGEPTVIYDKFPGDAPHGWKFLTIGPDGKLYAPVGANCNICEPDKAHARIFRMDLDGGGVETYAMGVRNTVGFDFRPGTDELWFTDNQRDWLSEEMPGDELNRVTRPGKQHFGFPYCHSGLMIDPDIGAGRSCDDFTSPEALLGAHAAPLGMRFYTGTSFPAKYRNAVFIARHGPWNRRRKWADVAVAFVSPTGTVTSVESFLTGFVENNDYLGRPVDVEVLKDGSLLVSDDHNGAIYRVSYVGG